jgi:hypothetical protein
MGGAWGAEVALVPEEKLGVVVLSNRDLNGLVGMLIFDVIDAFVVGPEQSWRKGDKWKRWLELGGPATWGRGLKEERARLERERTPGTQPSLPLVRYAGHYESTLYPKLSVTVVGDHLHVRFGDYSARLEHWERNRFYGRAVIEPYFDWLVTFDVDEDAHSISGLEFVNVGWKDADERFVFRRVPEL